MIDHEALNLVKMAEFLKLRKKTQSTTILFLGSRTGGFFRSNFLHQTLRLFSPSLDQLSDLQRFAECFRILNRGGWSSADVENVLRTALNEVDAQESDGYVAQLAKRGFFTWIVTANVDDLLQQAFRSTGMKAIRDFDVFVAKSNTAPIPTRYGNRNTLFTLIKAFGDLASREYNITNRLHQPESAENLRTFLDDTRGWNILIVGLDPTWDRHLIQALFPRKDGIVWYINEEPPSETSILAKYLRDCNAQCIIGPDDGRYEHEHFFHDLYDLIAESSDLYPPIQNTEPIAIPDFLQQDNTQQIIHLQQLPGNTQQYDTQQVTHFQQSLAAQAQTIRSQEQLPPTSLNVTVHKLFSHLPSGVLAYYNEQTKPLIKYEIVNNMTDAISVVLTAEVKGFSQPRVDTVDVAAQSHSVHYQLPLLDREKIATLTEIRRASVHVRVSYLKDNVEILYKPQDFDVHLMARNVIRWAIPDPTGSNNYLSLFEHIAAWVTPRKESVRAMLREAVDYHPRKVLVGYPQCPGPEKPRSQVKAIFLALKKVGKIAYVNSPFAIGPSGGDVLQAVRLPDESLREHQANCIDGAVLYASLLESAALHPIIVIQTGHAFVGWKTWSDATSYEFLETTMTLNSSFEQAHKAGMDSYHLLQENGWFNHEPFDPRGFARLLDIKKLHDEGIHPME